MYKTGLLAYTSVMRRHYFTKFASPTGVPIWIRVPGTPMSLPGRQIQYERLPGMTQWAPRDTIERMATGLEQGVPTADLVSQEEGAGGGRSTAIGAGIGGLIGTGAGRILGGEAATAPFTNILENGLNKRTFSNLRSLPRAMKRLPLLGVGAGALAGYNSWSSARPERRETADQVARGLLTEKVLQQSGVLNAAKSMKSNESPVLSEMNHESAHQASPYIATSGNMGV